MPPTAAPLKPHVLPLMMLVDGLRARGLDVPGVDPSDGGVNAQALFLLETPGPRCVISGLVSRDNPDPSARNMSKALDEAGFARGDVVLWNVVPQCVSTADQNANATMAQIRAAVPDTQAFIDRLLNLAVVVFCGRSAPIPLLRLPSHVQVLSTFHPGAQSYNRLECRNDIHETFRRAKAACRSGDIRSASG